MGHQSLIWMRRHWVWFATREDLFLKAVGAVLLDARGCACGMCFCCALDGRRRGDWWPGLLMLPSPFLGVVVGRSDIVYLVVVRGMSRGGGALASRQLHSRTVASSCIGGGEKMLGTGQDILQAPGSRRIVVAVTCAPP